MKEMKLVVEANCQISKLYDFTLDPVNTPLWIDGIVHEERNESPTRVGTKYRNVNSSGSWAEYEVTHLEQDKMFEMRKTGSSYHVRYSFKQLPSDKTEFTYHEWVDHGELEDPFSQSFLEKLKRNIEQSK